MTTSSEEPAAASAAGGPGAHVRPAWSGYALLMAGCAVLGLGLDQLTKWWVESTMHLGEVTDVLPPVLRWHYILNPGAAFSIGTGHTWVFTIIMVVVCAFLIYLMLRVRSVSWAIALGLVLGGAMGNLTDRLFREPSFGQGHVVDFIALPNFAIFNIADSCVVCGVILVCLLTVRGVGMDGQRTPSETGQNPAAETAETAQDSHRAVEGGTATHARETGTTDTTNGESNK